MILFTGIKFFKNDYPYKKPKSLSYIQISRVLLENNRLAGAQLGYIYKKIGQVDSGIYYLKKGIEIPHANGMVYFNLADCNLIKNDLDNAIGVFKLYLERKPSLNPVIYEGLAKLYIKKQDYTNAIENFKWAIRYPQGYEIPPEIFNLIGVCYFKTGDLRNAKIYWQMGLKKDKKYLPIIQNLKQLNE
uniref:Tetratricopeptide repeat protein n=1 Tax=candidate division WOR-3 bacterium TaxID=2052148 RepID=A0A7V1EH59_UNCW3